MTREILFRGKQVGNDKWVEGGYYENNTGKYIISPAFVAHLIIPSTVGQFTGLTDRNSTKIFDGDIVRYCDDWIGKIEYDSDSALFAVIFADGDDDNFGRVSCGDCEVIGNIYDSPGCWR